MLGFVRSFSRTVRLRSLVGVNGLIRSQSSRSCVGLSRFSQQTGLHSTANRELHNTCDPGYVPRSGVREFATAAGALAQPANDLNSLESRLALTLAKMKPVAKKAAGKALAALKAAEDHPSASLIERLIQDESAWPSVHDEWEKLADKKAKWEDLLALLGKDGADNVQSELERIGLTPGAAKAVTSMVQTVQQWLPADAIAPGDVTPLMKGLHAFPAALHRGCAVPDDLASLFTKEVQSEVKKYLEVYRNLREKDRNALVVDAVVKPLLEKLAEKDLWGVSGYNSLFGDEFQMPFWFSAHRRREMERILQVVWRFESIGSTSVNCESRVWFGDGKKEFMRVTALMCALLHERLVVGYNEYNKNSQFTPQNVLAMRGPEVHAPASRATMVTEMANRGLFAVYFADEVEHCCEKGNQEALKQFMLLADSTCSLCIVTGSVASLPDMIRPRQQSVQWRHLPTLDHSKMESHHFPPVANLEEARSLAHCILPAKPARRMLNWKPPVGSPAVLWSN
eukprot:TRINITY_DN3852_c0_g3_i1.p1 TRINITY_DN3852_c0_g3~~TRINITY_DN3852_c0_g3_i1.p1  ORF type:complete len:511 (+),score=75.26 TRINITY_DN3852_c0_g3_i1:180-1712(+)